MGSLKAHRVWLVMQVLALLLFAGAFGVDRWLSSRFRAAADALGPASQEVEASQAEAATLDRIGKELQRLQDRERTLYDRVPRRSEERATREAIWQLLSRSPGTELLHTGQWKFKEGDEGLVHAQREAQFRGGFHDLGRLIGKVEGLPFVVGVEYASIKRDRSRSDLLVLALRVSVPFQPD